MFICNIRPRVPRPFYVYMGNSDPGSLSNLCGLPRVMVAQTVTVPQTKPVCGGRQGDRMKRRDATPKQASSSLGASLYLRLALHIVWGAAMKWFSKARQTCFNREDQSPPSPHRKLKSRRTLVLWSRYHRYVGAGRQRLAPRLPTKRRPQRQQQPRRF